MEKLEKFLKIIPFENLLNEEKILVWKWRNHPQVSKNSFLKKVSLNKHLSFIESLKKTNKKKYYLVKYKKDYIGVFSFTNIKENKNFKIAELGTYINPENPKPAYGYILGEAIKMQAEKLKIKKLIAYVFPANKLAIKYNKFLGFKEKGIEKIKKNKKEFDVLKMILELK